MNAITKTLLAGAALGALATAPAVAGSVPHFSVTALHAGNVVNKTKVRDPSHENLTYTFDVSTYVPASDLRIKTKLPATYYKWNSTSCVEPINRCSAPPEKMKVPKKSAYAKLGWSTETYSLGCPSGATVFYGDTYKLTDPAGEGHTDSFVSTLMTTFTNSRAKYKGFLHLDVSVAIGE